MSVQIGSGDFRAIIEEKGAEIRSLMSRSSGTQYIWNADPAWWNGSAPVLFPIIGGLRNGSYSYQGRQYKLPSHGFARTSLFRLVSSTDCDALFELRADDVTRANYPFEFRLRVAFHVDYAGVTVRYEVTNEGSAPMYFSIGSHPAFVLPFGAPLEHYYLHFNREEQAERFFFDAGLLLVQSEPAFSNRRQLFITRTLFDRGPLIFKTFNSDEITLRCSRSPRAITVLTEDAPHLGIWSKPGGAPFLCIEPWHGLPDPVGSDGDITRKPGIRELAAGDSFATGYSILIT